MARTTWRIGCLALSLAILGLPSAAFAQSKVAPRIVFQSGNWGYSAKFSPDQRRIVSAGDGALRLWDVETGRVLASFEGHSDDVTAAAFSPDGRMLLSGGDDGEVKLWNAETGELVRTFDGRGDKVKSVEFSPDGRQALSAGWDNALKFWDVAAGALLKTIENKDSRLAVFSPDGRYAASAGENNALLLWDPASGSLVRTIGREPYWDAAAHVRIWERHSNSINSIAFSPDGRRLLSGSGDNTVKLWEAETGALLKTFEGRSGGVASAMFSPDGKWVLSGGEQGVLKLWDVETGQPLKTFEHAGPVESVAFSADGRRALSGGGGTLKLWEVETGALLKAFGGSLRAVSAAAFLPGGRRLLLAGDGALTLWDMAAGRRLEAFEGHAPPIENYTFSFADFVAFAPDGRRLLAARKDKTLTLWDAASGSALRTFAGPIDKIAISPDGVRALSASSQGEIHLWSLETGNSIKALRLKETGSAEPPSPGERPAPLDAAVFSPGGKKVIACGGGETRSWDAANGQPSRSDKDASCALSPNGRWEMVTSDDEDSPSLSFKNLKTKDLGTPFKGYFSNPIFLPDGRQAVATSGYRHFLWEVETGKRLAAFDEGSWQAVSPDGRLTSISRSGVTRLHGASTSELLLTFAVDKDGEWLAVTPAGFFDASARGAGLAHVVLGLETFPLERFSQRLRRPDLVEQRLKGDPHGRYGGAAARLDLAAQLGAAPR